jgi:ABC-type multidrug transport system fused ATPase/permease subunit
VSLLSETWRVLTPPQRRAVLAMQLVALLMAASTAGGIAAIAPFFAVLGKPALIEENVWLRWLFVAGGFAGPQTFMLALGAGFVLIVLLTNLVAVLGTLAMSRVALRIANELQTTLFEEYLSRPYSFHCARNSTLLLNNVLYETTRLAHGVLESAFTLVTALATAAMIIASIVMLKALVALAMVAALASGYGLIYLAVRGRLLRAGQTQSRCGGEQTQVVTESFGGIKEIIVLQVRGFFRRRFESSSREFLRAAARTQLIAQSPRHVMECVAAAGLVSLALALAAPGGGLGGWLGPLTFLSFATYRLLPTLQQVYAAVVRIRADGAAVGLIGADLRRARSAGRRPAPGDLAAGPGGWAQRPQREIRLNEISYRYAPERTWALQGVSLRIPARSTVGLVGANGSGKSTLLDVLAGLLVPSAGTVEVDGCELDASTRAAWQGQLACVPQQIFLLDASIAENIALGVAPQEVDQVRLREAARLAQLEDFIATLPAGYHQRVGERGLALSGGQRQRLGIARALYRQAAVLLLDEPTNSLDGLSERELVYTLGRLRGRCTIVLIAHRMSTVRACDLIFELADGRLCAGGTYEALLRDSPRFRAMARVR